MREEIVREYLSKGKLLTPDALQMLEGMGDQESITSGFMIGEGDVKETNRRKNDIKVIKNITTKKKEMKLDDFISFYRTNFERMKGIITGRLQKNFISLNKLDNYRDEVHVIGIVRDRKENEGKKIIEMDDSTATIPVIFDEDQDVKIGDVVAVRAVSARNVLFGKEIIYPDVPLRQPKTGHGRACFVSDLNINEVPTHEIDRFFAWFSRNDIHLLFIAGDFGSRVKLDEYLEKYTQGKTVFVIPGEKDTTEEYPHTPLMFDSDVTSLSNPSMVEVNGIKILMVHDFDIDMLKKRRIPTHPAVGEDFILDEIPDIVVHGHRQKPQILNYKSITIVNSGSVLDEFRPVVIDFETREANLVQIE